ncbi:hypothetical protein ACFS07_35290 [Undibacterium arcticum]
MQRQREHHVVVTIGPEADHIGITLFAVLPVIANHAAPERRQLGRYAGLESLLFPLIPDFVVHGQFHPIPVVGSLLSPS